MWNELGIDSDDLLIDRFYRLGSFHKAKQRTDNPIRPIIIAFQEYRNIDRILDAAYMLKGSGYSVTKDYPKEIVAARQRLTPIFKSERQNRNNKVSIEYPARLVVNRRVIKDEFPDWYQVLEYDRYKLASGDYSTPTDRPQCSKRVVQPPVNQSSSQSVSSGTGGAKALSPIRSYAHVASSVVQQQQPQVQLLSVTASHGSKTTSTSSSGWPVNVPRYTANNAGNQNRQSGSSQTTANTTNTMRSTTSTTSVTTTASNSQPSMSLNSN